MDPSKMNSVVNDPGNKGISVINQHNNPKINARPKRKKIMELSYSKKMSAVVKQTLAPTINNEKQLFEDCEDVFSIKGKFGWELIEEQNVPYIIRVINGEKMKFVSVRMAETHLLRKLLDSLNVDIYTCPSVRSYFVTDNEALLLNEINRLHCDFDFGNKMFVGRKDYIVRLEDIHQFYTFMKVCYETLVCNIHIGRKEKCGFIRINNFDCPIPYCIKDDQKYVPLFFFEGENQNQKYQAVKLENLDLAYLKFCFKVLGVRNEFFAGDSCIVASLDYINNYTSIDVHFEDFWPYKMDNTRLVLMNHNTPSGAWIITPPKVLPAEKTIYQALTALASVTSNSMPMMMNTNQNGQQANKVSSSMSQFSSFGYGEVPVVPQPPLVRADNRTPVISYTVSYSNPVPFSQCMITMYNPIENSDVMSHSNQMRKLNSQHATNNSETQQQLEQHKQYQQQQIITAPQTQLSNSSQSVHSRLTNSMICNIRRNIELERCILTPMATDIDLSSPPSGTADLTVEDTSLRPYVGFEFTRILERGGANQDSAYNVNDV